MTASTDAAAEHLGEGRLGGGRPRRCGGAGGTPSRPAAARAGRRAYNDTHGGSVVTGGLGAGGRRRPRRGEAQRLAGLALVYRRAGGLGPEQTLAPLPRGT